MFTNTFQDPEMWLNVPHAHSKHEYQVAMKQESHTVIRTSGLVFLQRICHNPL
jgi:hypothetical protein